ncbi:MAG TPA: SPFH domain-containing protein, partial [Bacteroidales bacterium]|nr:SPFH domain-containing protein [Bacteroidales bacterium]
MKNIQEKFIQPRNGWLMLFVSILGFMAGIALPIIFTESLGWAPVWYFLLIVTVFSFIAMFGLMVINPNESKVITFFGKYVGTVVDNGFFMVNPFVVKKTISLKARNLNSDPIKVNDKMGNPIMIGVVLVWRVKDTFKACFAVDNYEKFVDIQSEAAIRSLAGSYPYDDLEDEHADITLRSGGEEVND